MPLAQVVSDAQMERGAQSMERSVDRASTAIEYAGGMICGAVVTAAIGGVLMRFGHDSGVRNMKHLLAGSAAAGACGGAGFMRCTSVPPPPPTPEQQERMKTYATIMKPKTDTVAHAEQLLEQHSPMPNGVAQKWQLNSVTEKTAAFYIKTGKSNANAAFKNELHCSELPQPVIDRLCKTDLCLVESITKSHGDFIVDKGTGRYYWYSLRTESAVSDDAKGAKGECISIALMLYTSSFSMGQMVEGVESVTEHRPVYENRATPVLVKKGGIIFGEREYQVQVDKVQVGTEKIVTQKPVFKDHVFTPSEVEAIKSHMCRMAAQDAKMTLAIE